jgi:uncharacterized protein (DUF362 family)
MFNIISETKIAIALVGERMGYPHSSPFDPDTLYPEFLGGIKIGKERNAVYGVVRNLMRALRLDHANFDNDRWNPLGEIIRPGQKVLLKPNLVRHLHMAGGDYQAVVTHGSLVRCALDYVALALKGEGEIIVGDAPVQSADFGNMVERTGLEEVCNDVAKTWGIPVRLMDFRLSSVQLNEKHKIISGGALEGDTTGYVAVDLGKRSLLEPVSNYYEKFRVTSYNCQEMKQHHHKGKHEYLIPRSVLEADVVINLPKLKTHRKVGLTAALKNMVGINGHKDWLPHHRCGSIKEGGDEYLYPSFLKRLQTRLGEKIDRDPFSSMNPSRRLTLRVITRLVNSFAPDPYTEGSWYGNDTIWRTVLDLNRLLIYANKKGEITDTPQRKCLTIVDAIVAGEGEGPMEPHPKSCGLLIGGANPVAIDAVLATIVGFDYRKIPLIREAFQISDLPLVTFTPDDIQISSNKSNFNNIKVGQKNDIFDFTPPFGWIEHIKFKD